MFPSQRLWVEPSPCVFSPRVSSWVMLKGKIGHLGEVEQMALASQVGNSLPSWEVGLTIFLYVLRMGAGHESPLERRPHPLLICL